MAPRLLVNKFGIAALCLCLQVLPADASDISFHHCDASTGLPQVAVSGIAQDGTGDMWIGSVKCGLYRYDGYDAVRVFAEGCHCVEAFADTVIAGLDGRLVLGTGEGWKTVTHHTVTDIARRGGRCFAFGMRQAALVWTPTGGVCDSIPLPLPSSRTSVLLDADALYIASNEGYVYRYADRCLETVLETGCPVERLSRGSRGEVLVCTMGAGLLRLDPDGTPHSVSSDIPDYVQCSLFDGEGRLWAGTRDGICIIDSTWRRCTLCRKEFGIPTSLSHNSVRALFLDRQGGVWIGTYFGGVNYCHQRRSRFHTVCKGLGEYDLNDWIVGCIAEAPDGTVWIGTNEGGVNLLDPVTKRITRLALPCRDVKAFCFHAGQVYIGTHGAGLLRYDPAAGKTVKLPVSSNVAFLRFLDDTSLLYGTEERRYSILNLRTGKSKSYNGVPDEEVSPELPGLDGIAVAGCEKDGSGRLWVSTDNGLLRYDTATGVLRRYGTADGLASDYFLVHSHCRASDGTLYFGGIGGVTYFTPSDFDAVFPAPMPFIDRVVVDWTRQIDLCGKPALKLSSRCKQLEITFRVSDYVELARDRFEYRLEGFDPDWHAATADGKAVFSRLPKGRYSLDVRALSSDGEPVTSRGALSIRVCPPWYASAVGLTLEILLLALCICAVFRAVLKHRSVQNELKLMRLEEAHREEVLELKTIRALNRDINVNSRDRVREVRQVPSAYDGFLRSVMRIIQDNISNPDLSTEFLAEKMRMNRTTLYKKILAATGSPALKLIHKVRFMEACRLLKEGRYSVSEICYKVGYTNPSNFSTSFKKEVGCLPSEYAARSGEL